MITTKNSNHNLVIDEKFFTKVIIVLLLLSVVFVAGNWSRIKSTNQNPVITNNSALVTNPAVRRRAENALTEFTGGFIGQSTIGDPSISYFIQNPSMSVGFGQSNVKMLINDKIKKNIPSYTEISQTFLNSNVVKPIAKNPISSHSSYFIGSSTGTTKQEYSTILYKNLYNNIDLEYTIHNGALKYNFYVYPGGNPNSIHIQWHGPVTLEKTLQGMQITVMTHSGQKTLLDNQPVSLQPGSSNNIQSRYVLENLNSYTFNIGEYNTKSLLIIDPSFLLYSSYFGGTNYGSGSGIAVDQSGNIYVTGSTSSTDFPTFNAIQNTYGTSSSDAFVIKLSSSGSLIYSTYIGATGYTQGNSIAVDNNGHAFVTGSTSSSTFPMVNAYNSTYGGNGDAFVLKLSESGTRLMYSTYVGGSNSDQGESIAIDSVGNAYVTGETYSINFPTSYAYSSTPTGGGNYYDVFVFCLASGGSSMYYSTFVSGTKDDYAYGIAVDSFGNTYVTGSTTSSNFPTTAGVFNGTFGGFSDVFVFKLSFSNYVLSLVYSTFIGGSNGDEGHGIAVDANNNTYVTGYTLSSDFPTTTGAFNRTYGYYDAFVFKLSSTGSSLLYSTFVGGNQVDSGRGIVIDNSGNAYVAGYSASRNFPLTSNAYDNQTPSYEKAIIFELSPTGSSLLYSTYVGGYGYDYAYAIARDLNGNIYSTGSTQSSDFPITTNAYQNTYSAGSGETFVFKLTIPSVASMTPGQPIVISSNSTDSIGLIWNAPSFLDSFLHYNVYRGTSSGNYSLIGISPESHFVDNGITSGITYHYAVSPVYSFGSGYKSADVVVILQTVPSAPTAASSSANTSTSSKGLPGFDVFTLVILASVASIIIISKRKK